MAQKYFNTLKRLGMTDERDGQTDRLADSIMPPFATLHRQKFRAKMCKYC